MSAIVTSKTLFYHLDPHLVDDPDGTLNRDTIVTLLSRQLGFSRVRLTNGEVVFVAAHDLAPVQPLSATPTQILTTAPGNSPRQIARGAKSEAPVPETLDMSDTPLPEPPTGGTPKNDPLFPFPPRTR